MSVENVRKFIEVIEGNQDLQKKIEAITVECDAEAFKQFSEIARQSGFDFTEKDFESVIGELDEGELSEDEMKNTSGGWGSRLPRLWRTRRKKTPCM